MYKGRPYEGLEKKLNYNNTANEKLRHIVGIFKNTRICHEYVGNWLIQHEKLAKSTEVVLK